MRKNCWSVFQSTTRKATVYIIKAKHGASRIWMQLEYGATAAFLIFFEWTTSSHLELVIGPLYRISDQLKLVCLAVACSYLLNISELTQVTIWK